MAATAPPDESYGQGQAEVSCVVCRSRKVRCDKTLPTCLNCKRLGVPCPGFTSEEELKRRIDVEKSADDIFKAAGVEKRRVGSCEECRASKHRCTKTKPSCRRCINRKIPCVYSSKPETKASKKQAKAAKKMAEAESGRKRAKIMPHPIYNSELAEQERQARLQMSSSEEPSPPPTLLGVDFASLCTDTLPSSKTLQSQLLDLFFNQTACLRLLSFIHRPSFMEAFDQDAIATEYGESLLYMMCALGARSAFYDEYVGRRGCPEETDEMEMPGARWAERARNDVLLQIHSPTIQLLMSMLLICEYGLLESRNAMVFTMIAFVYRSIRLLSLDTPGKLDESASQEDRIQRECEVRIVWACYFVDAMVGTGVEKNLFWTDDLPTIPLPSPSYNAPFEDTHEYFLDLLDSALLGTIVPRLDYQAISLLAVTLRTRVMREIRNPDVENAPWHKDSRLINILSRVKVIQDNLPPEYSLNLAKVDAMMHAGVLGGVFAMHILLHAVVFDLTRVSLPGFSFPLAERFRDAPTGFVQECQQQCFSHAEQVSHLIRKATDMNRMAYSDAFCADVAMETAKIQIIYSATLSGMPQLVSGVRANVRANIDFILGLDRSWETKRLILQGLLPVCEMFGYKDLVEKYDLKKADEVEVSGHQDTHHLSILAAFRLGRTELQDRNEGPAATRGSKTISSALIQASGRAPVRKMSVKGSTQLQTLSELVKSSSAEQTSGDGRANKPLQLLPSMGSRSRSIFQPSMEDYKVTATNASELIKRGLSDLSTVLTRRRRRSTITDGGRKS